MEFQAGKSRELRVHVVSGTTHNLPAKGELCVTAECVSGSVCFFH